MQTLHSLRSLLDLRAIFLGRSPSRWPTRSMQAASKWETLYALPNPLRPSLAWLGLRADAVARLIGTGPESGAVPRGRQHQRAIRFWASLVGEALPDRVCRTSFVPQTATGDLPSLCCGARRADHQLLPACLRVGMAACLPARMAACQRGSLHGRSPARMSARQAARRLSWPRG